MIILLTKPARSNPKRQWLLNSCWHNDSFRTVPSLQFNSQVFGQSAVYSKAPECDDLKKNPSKHSAIRLTVHNTFLLALSLLIISRFNINMINKVNINIDKELLLLFSSWHYRNFTRCVYMVPLVSYTEWLITLCKFNTFYILNYSVRSHKTCQHLLPKIIFLYFVNDIYCT